MSDYSKRDVEEALEKLPLRIGDVVFCHSNIGFFGRAEGYGYPDAPCKMWFDAIFERIGKRGTLVVPTFTYSYPRGEEYSAFGTPSKMGMFAEYVRNKPSARRSVDPCYSVAACGPYSWDITRCTNNNSFDDWSSFGTLLELGGKVLNMNFDAGSTFIHYVERKLGVPYRFDKEFCGVTRTEDVHVSLVHTIYVRYMHEALEPHFEEFDRIARERNLFQTAKVGRGEIGVISAADTFALIEDVIKDRPWFLTKAETMGIIPKEEDFKYLR